MIRPITRPATAKCTLPKYIGFLLSEPNSVSCLRVGEVLGISHDSVNRFLHRETYDAKDLFNEAMRSIDLVGGTLSVDDSVLDKPYAHYIAYLGYFWSGKHHAVVKGINLITMYYTDPTGTHMPMNFRIYDKSDNKTKNDYFLDMLREVLEWGLRPSVVTGDSWYSSVDNLKTIKKYGLGLQFAIESNRTVSMDKGSWTQVQNLDIPEDGLVVWLKGFGTVKIFRTLLKNQKRHYIVNLPEEQDTGDQTTKLEKFKFVDFIKWHDDHWTIEQYHRGIKQVCNIESFQVRSKSAVKTHIFAAICGFIELQRLSAADILRNCYALQRDLFNNVIAAFVENFAPTMKRLDPQFAPSVNA